MPDHANATANERVAISLKKLIQLAQPASLLNLHQIRIRSQQTGGYVSRFKGRGMEFDEARLYQPGDDIRTIDWRVTARTGKPHTKIFREERERPVFLSVDHRIAMQFATRGVFKSVQAAKLAGLLAWSAQHQGDRIGGQLFTDTICQEIKPKNGKHAVLRFFNLLVSTHTQPANNITLTDVFARLTQHARPGSLVYIISDFRGFNQMAETHLAKLTRHCDVVLIQVYDALETQLPTQQGCYRFTDDVREIMIDSGEKQRVLAYQQRYQQHLHALQNTCQRVGSRLLHCSTTDNPVEVLR